MNNNEKTFSSYFELITLIQDMKKKGKTLLEIFKELEEYENHIDTNGVSFKIEDMLPIMKNSAHKNSMFQKEECRLYLSELQHLFEIEDEDVRKILFFYLLLAKFSNHTWPKNERDYVFGLYGKKLTNEEKTKLMQRVCKNGLELRVIGRAKPEPCFHLTFFKEEGDTLYVANKDESPTKLYNHIFNGG